MRADKSCSALEELDREQRRGAPEEAAPRRRGPALLLARRVGCPVRTMRGWLNGRVPRYASRVVLDRVFGIPLTAWEAS